MLQRGERGSGMNYRKEVHVHEDDEQGRTESRDTQPSQMQDLRNKEGDACDMWPRNSK